MKISFKEWLNVNESNWITPHDIEGLNNAAAFVYTKGKKLYIGQTHEEICGYNYEQLKKDHPNDMGLCDDNSWAFNFALTGRYAPLTSERAKRIAKQSNLSEDTFQNLIGKIIVTFWNNGTSWDKKDDKGNTKLLFDELLIPCLKALEKQVPIFSTKIWDKSHNPVTSDDIIVSIYNDEPKPLSHYLKGGKTSSSDIDEDKRKMGMEKMAFHRKKWADGRPLSPQEYETLKKKYGAPSGPPSKLNNAPQNKHKGSFNDGMKELVKTGIINFDTIKNRYITSTYLFFKNEKSSNLYVGKNTEEIIQKLKEKWQQENYFASYTASAQTAKNNYESAIKAANGDGGFIAIGVLQIIPHDFFENPKILQIWENYDMENFGNNPIIVINPSSKNTSSFTSMIDDFAREKHKDRFISNEKFIVIYGSNAENFVII